MKTLLSAFCLSLVLIGTDVTAQRLTISNIQIASSIEGQQPTGVDTAFTADIGSVFCFTQIEGVINNTTIFQVWYHKDEEKARIELNLESDDWQTWGSQSIMQNLTGPWRVMIEDTNGTVLATTSFHIRE